MSCYRSGIVDSVTEARKRQIARLDGVKPPTARKAMALAKSKAYQDGADAEATLRAYATDLANFEAWCAKYGFTAMPATPEVVGAYLAAAGEGYAMPTLRRRVAAIARACGVAGHPLDTKHPAIRKTLRGIGRKHGTPARRAAALTTTEVRKLCRACGAGLAGARDRALFLIGFAGAMRRSELIGLDVGHVTWTDEGLKLLVERSKTDKQGEGAKITIPLGNAEETWPVAALKEWLELADQSRAAVPQSQPRRRGRERPAECGRGAPNPAQACRRSRFERHAGRTGQPTRTAGGVRDDGLSQRSARRGDHGAHPTPEPDHHAQLRPTGQAQPSQPGWETRVVAGRHWGCIRFTAARLQGSRHPARGGPTPPTQRCRRRRRDL
jgi:integrase